MSVKTRAYDKTNDDGFPPDPVVVLVAEGAHDISRLVNALARGNSEQHRLAGDISRKLRRHNGGRAALSLLKHHGGADFTAEDPDEKGWNTAIDWLLNSRHVHAPVVEHFWHITDGEKCDCTVAL